MSSRFILWLVALAAIFVSVSAAFYSLRVDSPPLIAPAQAAAGLRKALPVSVVGDPRLVALPPVRDLGKVGQGEVLNAEFILANRGDQAIEIRGVDRSCSCTDAKIDKTRIEPGGESRVSATWRTSDSHGRSSTGLTISHGIAGGSTMALPIKIVGDVIPDVSCDTTMLLFARETPRVENFEVTLKNGIKITGITPSHDSFRARFAPAQSKTDVSTVSVDRMHWRTACP